jgi:hypothetical protein
MKRRAIVGLGLVIGLCACASQTSLFAPANMAWAFQQDPDEGAKLAYGAPSSDNVVLMMTCRPGSARVALSALTTEKAPKGVTLVSGEAKGQFRGAPTSGFEGEVSLVEAMAPAGSPALKGFHKTGDLTLIDGRRKVKIAAGDKDKAAVDRFFKSCVTA